MTITLPDEWRAGLEARAKAAGFRSVDAYVIYLVMEATRDEGGPEESAALDIPDPPEDADYVVNSREELEAKILAGLDSGPPIPVTPAFWEDVRKRVAERLAARARRQA